jgi:hypothetical protein
MAEHHEAEADRVADPVTAVVAVVNWYPAATARSLDPLAVATEEAALNPPVIVGTVLAPTP